MHWGGEVEFRYKGTDYSVTYIPNTDRIAICKAYQPETEFISTDIEEILNYLMDDGKKLREVIKEVDVTASTI